MSKLRRRRSLISAQGLERSDNPGYESPKCDETLKGFGGWRTLSGFKKNLLRSPRVLRYASNLGLKLANAVGVKRSSHNQESVRFDELFCLPIIVSR